MSVSKGFKKNTKGYWRGMGVSPGFFLARAIELQRLLEKEWCGCRISTVHSRTVNEDIYMLMKGYKYIHFSDIRKEIQMQYY